MNNKINRQISLGLAGLVSLLSVSVIIGWLTSTNMLIRVFPNYPPMQFFTATAFLLISISLALTILGYRKESFYPISVVALIATLTLGEYIFRVDLGIDRIPLLIGAVGDGYYPGRISPNASFCFLLASIYICMINFSKEDANKKLISIYLSLIVFVIAFISFVGFTFHARDIYAWGSLNQMAYHTSIGFMLWSLAAGFFVLGSLDLTTERKKFFIPLLIFFSSAILFTIMWYSLVKKEVRDVHAIISLTERKIEMQFEEALDLQIKAIKRKAQRWEVAGGIPEKQWEADADAYLRDYPALDKLNFTTEHYETFLIMPPEKNAAGNYTFRLVMPIVTDNQNADALEAEIDINKFMMPIMADEQDYYHVQINYRGQVIYQNNGTVSPVMVPYEKIEDLKLGNDVIWEMHVWPTEATVSFYQSWITGVILVFGLLVAASLALMYGFLQSFRELESKNRAALNQVIERSSELNIINKELESFSYSVSHDLRAPLRHVRGFIDLIEKNKNIFLDDTGKKHFQYVKEAAEKMSKLIDDLLGFSRAGRVEIKKENVNLNALIRKSRERLSGEMSERNIVWEVSVLPTVFIDHILIGTVFDNLLGNAIKFTKNKDVAKIKITVSENDKEYIICVEDNGAGFEQQYADKIFAVFQRLHTPEEFPGTGVGLANAQRIIHRHGGRVWAEGEVGQGARIYFTLPKSEEALK